MEKSIEFHFAKLTQLQTWSSFKWKFYAVNFEFANCYNPQWSRTGLEMGQDLCNCSVSCVTLNFPMNKLKTDVFHKKNKTITFSMTRYQTFVRQKRHLDFYACQTSDAEATYLHFYSKTDVETHKEKIKYTYEKIAAFCFHGFLNVPLHYFLF